MKMVCSCSRRNAGFIGRSAISRKHKDERLPHSKEENQYFTDQGGKPSIMLKLEVFFWLIIDVAFHNFQVFDELQTVRQG